MTRGWGKKEKGKKKKKKASSWLQFPAKTGKQLLEGGGGGKKGEGLAWSTLQVFPRAEQKPPTPPLTLNEALPENCGTTCGHSVALELVSNLLCYSKMLQNLFLTEVLRIKFKLHSLTLVDLHEWFPTGRKEELCNKIHISHCKEILILLFTCQSKSSSFIMSKGTV